MQHKKKVLESFRSLILTNEIIIPNQIPDKYFKEASKILGKINKISELLKFKLDNGYPLFMFYDGVLK